MRPPLVLDTNVFTRRDFIQWLESYRERKILPAVAYAELYVWFVGIKRRTPEKLDLLLRKAKIEFQRLNKENCINGAEWGIKNGNFKEHWKDYLIASHAPYPPYHVITENKRHFTFLGNRVMNIDEAMSQL